MTRRSGEEKEKEVLTTNFVLQEADVSTAGDISYTDLTSHLRDVPNFQVSSSETLGGLKC